MQGHIEKVGPKLKSNSRRRRPGDWIQYTAIHSAGRGDIRVEQRSVEVKDPHGICRQGRTAQERDRRYADGALKNDLETLVGDRAGVGPSTGRVRRKKDDVVAIDELRVVHTARESSKRGQRNGVVHFHRHAGNTSPARVDETVLRTAHCSTQGSVKIELLSGSGPHEHKKDKHPFDFFLLFRKRKN